MDYIKRSHFIHSRLKSKISGGFLFYGYLKCTSELLKELLKRISTDNILVTDRSGKLMTL